VESCDNPIWNRSATCPFEFVVLGGYRLGAKVDTQDAALLQGMADMAIEADPFLELASERRIQST
jgi:hypothetical protein